MSARLTASDRLARLLAVIPWVVEQDGALLDEISARFDYPRDQLVADLEEVLFFVGVHPFTPDALVDVDISDDRVHIRYADWFSKPLRLTPDEGARLLTAGRSVLSLTGGPDDDTGPLLRALTKLQLALGDGADQAVEVRLGEAPDDVLDVVRGAIASRRRVSIEYYSYGSDRVSTREVDPVRVFSDQGHWYLAGWCHVADDDRVFRVDRIRSAVELPEPSAHHDSSDVRSFSPDGTDPRVVLRLAPSARWVVEQYPVESLAETADGIEVRLAVTAVPWLERLLLRLGPDAEVVHADPPLDEGIRVVAARRVLERYRSGT